MKGWWILPAMGMLLMTWSVVLYAGIDTAGLRPFIQADCAAGVDVDAVNTLRRDLPDLAFVKKTSNPGVAITDSLLGHYIQVASFEGAFDLVPGTNTAVVPQGGGLLGQSIEIGGVTHRVTGVYTAHPMGGESRIFVPIGGSLDTGEAAITQLYLPAQPDELGIARLVTHLEGVQAAGDWCFDDNSHTGRLVVQWQQLPLFTGALFLGILTLRLIGVVTGGYCRAFQKELRYVTLGVCINNNFVKLLVLLVKAAGLAVLSGLALKYTAFDFYLPASALPPRYVLDVPFYIEYFSAHPVDGSAWNQAVAAGGQAFLTALAGMLVIVIFCWRCMTVWKRRRAPWLSLS